MLLHEMIAARRAEIVARFRSDVRAAAVEAKTLARSEIEDNIPGLLDEIVIALSRQTSIPDSSPNAAEHGKQRLRVGFDLNTVVREYGILCSCILDFAASSGVDPTLEEFHRLARSLNVGVSDAVVEYSQVRFRLFEMFVSVLSRDLKNPLQAISSGAEMLQRPVSRATDVIARIAAQLAHGTARIHRILDQLLDLSRVGLGGGFALQRQRFDLTELCAQVVKELSDENPGRVIVLMSDGVFAGSWDRARLHQVLSNLGINALTHGSGTSAVQFRLLSDVDEVLVEVHNEGKPIAHSEFARLFDPFRQQPEAAGGGLGLGLYIVREIVREHGGAVEVESSEDAGTTFRVRLPRTQA
jgi:signal transduction histidine kinase